MDAARPPCCFDRRIDRPHCIRLLTAVVLVWLTTGCASRPPAVPEHAWHALAANGFPWLDHPLGADRRELVAEQ